MKNRSMNKPAIKIDIKRYDEPIQRSIAKPKAVAAKPNGPKDEKFDSSGGTYGNYYGGQRDTSKDKPAVSKKKISMWGK